MPKQITPCPSCGGDTSGSEEWSTGQCDDCWDADHEPSCASRFGCTTEHHFDPCESA